MVVNIKSYMNPGIIHLVNGYFRADNDIIFNPYQNWS